MWPSRLRVAPLALAILVPAVGKAQTYAVEIRNGRPDIGRVVSSPAGETIFRIDANTGAVTRISGSGARLSTGVSRAKVTITCGSSGTCNNRKVNVRIGSVGSPSGRAGELENFTVAMGSAVLDSVPTGSNPIGFTLKPIGKNASKTFWVGMDLPIKGNTGGGPTGAASAGFYVHAVRHDQSPTSGDTGLALANVFRPISLSKLSNLSFGRLVKPISGAGTVTVTPGGDRLLTNIVGVPTPAAAAASYTVHGESGRSISLSIPSTFVMNGPVAPLSVRTVTNAEAAPVLSVNPGFGGSYGFQIGGAFDLAAETPSGAYSGAFTVTVSYN